MKLSPHTAKTLTGMFRWLKQNHKRSAVALIIFLAAYLLLGYKLKLIIIVFALVAAASMSTFYYNYFHSPVNIELVKFSTILASASYGAAVGIPIAILTTILSRLWSGRLDHRILISLLGIIIVAALASIISIGDIRLFGIIFVAAYHIITVPISIITGDNPAFTLTYAATNMLFNAALFYTLAPIMFSVIKV